MIEKLESEPLIKKHDTTPKPNTKRDMCNIFVLFVLYTLEGVPLGLVCAIQIILQNKHNTSFKDQVNNTSINFVKNDKTLANPYGISIRM